jgi:hypothetical protein
VADISAIQVVVDVDAGAEPIEDSVAVRASLNGGS